MARNFEDIMASLPQERQRAIHQGTQRLIAEEMNIRELRRRREISQQIMGQRMGVNQTAVSRMERRNDMQVTTLRSFVEAMGGRLTMLAQFPDQPPVRITPAGSSLTDPKLDNLEFKEVDGKIRIYTNRKPARRKRVGPLQATHHR